MKHFHLDPSQISWVTHEELSLRTQGANYWTSRFLCPPIPLGSPSAHFFCLSFSSLMHWSLSLLDSNPRFPFLVFKFLCPSDSSLSQTGCWEPPHPGKSHRVWPTCPDKFIGWYTFPKLTVPSASLFTTNSSSIWASSFQPVHWNQVRHFKDQPMLAFHPQSLP